MAPVNLGEQPTVPVGPPVGADELAAGTRAGDYVIEKRLGVGGMGEVYAGRHPVIGKRVAIKVLRRELGTRPDSAERFLREARASNQIDHPNVVDVFAMGQLEDGRLFLAMDLLDGLSLRERLARDPLPSADALRVLRQIAAAVDAAHARGVVHRDLKPDNVMLTEDADGLRAHVLDFGIAKLVADAAGDEVATLTGQGAWLGTPAYMAPEQWTADGAVAASDRYALAVVAFELLTGKPPFAAPSLPAMMEQHFRAAVPSVATAAGRALPAGLDAVFARALAKDPDERHPSALAFVEALGEALAGRAVARRGRPWIAAAGIAVVAGAAVVLTTGGDDRRPSSSPSIPGPPPTSAAAVRVTSNPSGAEVRRAGERLGDTPLVVTATDGPVDLEIAAPGCVTVARRVEAALDHEVALHVDLALASGFDGTWRLPDGELRTFERRGDQVLAYRQRAPGAAREFLRQFSFAPAPLGAVAFAASEPFVAEEAPDEPSCHIPLRAEYAYRPGGDRLELRRERAKVEVVDGHCRLAATAWSDWRTLERVATAVVDEEGWTESRAGGAPVAIGKPVWGKKRPPGKAARVGSKGSNSADPLAPDKLDLADAASAAKDPVVTKGAQVTNPTPTKEPPVTDAEPVAKKKAPPIQQQAPSSDEPGPSTQAPVQTRSTAPGGKPRS